MQNLIVYIILFQIIFNVNCQYVPMGRSLHTATLVGTKIYFFGGTTVRINIDKDMKVLNDFFYLDISKSFDKTKEALSFVDLSDMAIEIPPHYGATTSVFGELRDTIFFFGGNMGKLNDQLRLTYSFNTTQVKWRTVTISQGAVPLRKQIMGAVTDNNDKIYIFGGGLVDNVDNPNGYYYSGGMDIFDTINKIWTSVETGLVKRDGHTATFLPDTGEIIYIGGITPR
jgi:N-acetylneuraminic acid mutarotase